MKEWYLIKFIEKYTEFMIKMKKDKQEITPVSFEVFEFIYRRIMKVMF